jgi:hypothetical protein
VITWTELRNVALVGTDRRQLTTAGGDPAPAGLPALPAGLGPEVVALHHAALLGIRQRAGSPLTTAVEGPDPTDQAPSPSDPEPEPGPGSGSAVYEPSDPIAPRAATKILELVLAGDVVTHDLSARLIRHWLDLCHATGHVLPHDLLPAALDRGRQSVDLRAHLRPALGRRGRWLASLNERWAWAHQAAAPDGRLDAAALLGLSTEQKGDALRRLRRHDAAAGRALLAEVQPELSAAERAVCLAALEVGVGPDDEPPLETALDDRSKKVRAAAVHLLDGLPGSRRAARLLARLEPLVSTGGRFRRGVTVAFPDPPTGDDQRDLRAVTDPRSTVESRWLITMVAGSPLAWWERALDATPSEIVRKPLTPEPELVAGWTMAAVAEQSSEWAEALLAAGHVDHRLADVVDEDALVATVERLPQKPEQRDVDLAGRITSRTGPWGEALSTALVDWTMSADLAKRSFPFEATFAANLHPGVASRVEQLLDQIDDHRRRQLRRVLHVLSLHTSITEAFR